MDKKQEQLAKLQCILTGVAAACCLGILILVCTLMPRVYGLVEQTETVLTNLEAVRSRSGCWWAWFPLRPFSFPLCPHITVPLLRHVLGISLCVCMCACMCPDFLLL